MYKLSSRSIDFYDDKSVEEYVMQGIVPDFVKSASLPDKASVASLPEDMFAVVVMTKTGSRHKKYPVVDKANTWISCKAFQKTANELPSDAAIVAASNLKRSCMLYDMPVPSYVEKLASNTIRVNFVEVDEKKATLLKDESLFKKASFVKHAVVMDTKWGIKSMYPLDTPSNVAAASSYLSDNLKTMPIKIASQFATNLVEAANTLDVPIPEETVKLAQNIPGSRAFVNIMARTKMTDDPMEKQAIETLAVKSKSLPAIKTASYLKEIDEALGITKYASKIKCPILSVTESWIKIAEDSVKKEKDPDDIFKKDDVEAYAAASADSLKEHLPHDLVEQFRADPVPTLNEMSPIQKQVVKDGMLGRL